jgi:hypothetical protein
MQGTGSRICREQQQELITDKSETTSSMLITKFNTDPTTK